MVRKKDSVYLIVYIFFLLFLPPIIKGINILLPMTLFSLLLIVFKYRNDLKKIVFTKEIKRCLILLGEYFGVYALSILLNYILNNSFYGYNYFISLYSIGLVVVCIPICSLYVILFSKRRNISFDEIIKMIIIAGLIQSAIAILCLVFPSIKKLLLDIMYYTTGEKLYIHQYNVERRFFGFANNLLDSFGFGTGLLAILPLYYSIRNGKKWVLTIPFLLLICILNSRTGLVIFAIGVIIFLIYILKYKKFKEYIGVLAMVALVTALFMGAVSRLNKPTVTWINNDFKSFVDNNTTGTAQVLLSDDFWSLPKGVELVFGNAQTIAGYGNLKDVIGFTSDVGYINELWKTGIVGLIIMLVFFYCFIRAIYKKSRRDYKFLILSLVPIILAANVKFYVLCCNPGITIVILIVFYLLLDLKEKDKKEKDLVSVIVPVYNVSEYLESCLNSIIEQTYTNIEIILVNDGSTDDSKNICKKYQKKDSRIIYIEQKNMGLSGARNRGIKESHGKYIMFIDSDDYVNKYFVEKLHNVISLTKVDMAFCRYKYVFNQNDDISVYEDGNIKVYDNNQKYANLYNYLRDYMVVAWNKIYDRKLFKNIEYPVGKIHEDQYIICELLEKSKKVAYTNEELYYYLQRDNSITGQYKFNRTDILEALKNKMNFFQEKKMKRLSSYALYEYFYQLIVQNKKVTSNFPEKKEFIQFTDNEIKKYQKNVFLNVYINILRKLKLIFMLKKV